MIATFCIFFEYFDPTYNGIKLMQKFHKLHFLECSVEASSQNRLIAKGSLIKITCRNKHVYILV